MPELCIIFQYSPRRIESDGGALAKHVTIKLVGAKAHHVVTGTIVGVRRCYRRLVRSGGNVVVGVAEGRHFGRLGVDKVHCVVLCQDTAFVTPKAKAQDVVMWPPRAAATRPRRGASDDKDASQLTTLILHPPLTLQNLLCVNIVCCVFRIVASSPAPPSSSGRDVVWEGTIKTGGHAAIYASNLADKLYCSVLLPALQCETVKPALLHVPPSSKAKVDTAIAFADKTNNTQPLKLKVENPSSSNPVKVAVGSGGQRAVILYASYWLVNLTPFGLQYKQDTRHFEIAGSAAALARRQSIDGDKQNLWNVLACDLELGPYLNPVDAAVTADDGLHGPSLSCMPSIRPQDGRCSFVADSHELCYCPAPTCAVRRLARFATMFSFGGGGNSVGGLEDTMTAAFTNNLCIKCPKYSWSKGVSLEVLGVDQVVELKNTTHVLELGVKIVPGPDAFFRTKCVIFTPRFLLLNQLSTSLALYDGLHRLDHTHAPLDVVRRFMEFLGRTEELNDPNFTETNLLDVTPEDIRRYFNLKASLATRPSTQSTRSTVAPSPSQPY
ncbi:hypothetical protein H310_02801 [Aphanomyces invadans]|uniref:Vacuolar protein sorting-associated protein 13 VPS13 adaptor binding domain-containing protein n=1 Tax=Aphanomyces invadans TaxID=157072 RepID=A0A024ULT6_9STRA|nr:hypothetical protein H310_02801 [Aphanomyces invadans]ETW06583.1 hypothetical protein H310_02801 [Aphanomyces invadans]|eukprot:XP_008864658.1 hypothetical protein H310_02801 [Aphanomyces invadans]